MDSFTYPKSPFMDNASNFSDNSADTSNNSIMNTPRLNQAPRAKPSLQFQLP
ncbi:hypothetical protein OXX79_011663, partial [Metschnikowia pulcherrima]